VSVADGALKIKNTNTDKTEFKIKLERGCVQARARDDVPNLLMLSFFVTRSNPTPKTFALLAEDKSPPPFNLLLLCLLLFPHPHPSPAALASRRASSALRFATRARCAGVW